HSAAGARDLPGGRRRGRVGAFPDRRRFRAGRRRGRGAQGQTASPSGGRRYRRAVVAPAMKWEQLTTREIDAIDRRTVVILPIAAVEQHGAHLPLSTDCTIGMHFLEKAEERCGTDMLLLPQI